MWNSIAHVHATCHTHNDLYVSCMLGLAWYAPFGTAWYGLAESAG